MKNNDNGASASADRATAVEPVPVSPLRDGISSADIEAAILVALHAHRGQKDLAGEPYILHPLRVMGRCKTNEQKVAAILHDVIEDSAIPLEQIADSFGPVIAEAVDALSRREGEKYTAFIRRCSRNEIACEVKLWDLNDNLDLSRLPYEPGQAELTRVRKYENARNYLWEVQNARGTEAGTAETGTGSVHDGPVVEDHAPSVTPPQDESAVPAGEASNG